MLPRNGLLVLLTSISQAMWSNASYTQNAEAAASSLLNEWYDTTSGLWDTTGWWQAANTLTTLTDLAALDSTVYNSVTNILSNTYARAPNTYPGYLNDFYDDEGWWALAWIQAYNLTSQPAYLQNAISIFDDMTTGWSTPCSGGIWWDKPHSYISAISNELFLSVAAHLANLVSSNSTYYLAWAEAEWAWFLQSGLINSANLINDGVDTSSCANNGRPVYSYNQGVLLGGLVQLNVASPNATYLTTAQNIASAAMSYLSDANGIVSECSTGCDTTGQQFKGVFLRNLAILQNAAPNDSIEAFIQRNADSVWTNRDQDAAGNVQLGQAWDSPFSGPGNATAQSAGLDALVAAAGIFG